MFLLDSLFIFPVADWAAVLCVANHPYAAPAHISFQLIQHIQTSLCCTLTKLFVPFFLPIFIINLEKQLTSHWLQGKHSFNLLTWEAVSHKNYKPLKDLIPKCGKRHLGGHSVHLHSNFCYHKEYPFILPLFSYTDAQTGCGLALVQHHYSSH